MEIIDPKIKAAMELLGKNGYKTTKRKVKPLPEFMYVVKVVYVNGKGDHVNGLRAVFGFQKGIPPKGAQRIAKVRITDLKWVEIEDFKKRQNPA